MARPDTVDLDVEVLRETDKALLILPSDGDEEVWVPKSVITDDSEVFSLKSSPGVMQVAGWWAREHGYAE